MENVNKRICQSISKVTGIPVSMLTPDFDLVDSGIVDSIQILQLIDDLEKEFSLKIVTENLSEFTSLKKISEAILKSVVEQEEQPIYASL